MKYQYVFFDFNGTILDDVDLCLNLLNEMLNMKSLPTVNKKKYREIFTFPIISYYQKAGFTFEDYTFEELASYFIEKYQPSSLKCKLYPGLIELLNYLKTNKVRLVVLSASKLSNLKEQINHFGLESYFDCILGIDDIYAKSKFEIAKKYFIKNMIDPKKCLFIGDTIHDYEVATSLNSSVFLVDFGHQSRDKLLQMTNNVFSSFEEIRRLL